MKYLIHVMIDPESGARAEEHPEQIQQFLAVWQSLDPVAYYLGVTQREAFIVVDGPNEEAFLQQLRETWLLTSSYPEVHPVIAADEAPAMMERMGIV